MIGFQEIHSSFPKIKNERCKSLRGKPLVKNLLRVWRFSRPYFLAFGLNTKRYGVLRALRARIASDTSCIHIKVNRNKFISTDKRVLLFFTIFNHSSQI